MVRRPRARKRDRVCVYAVLWLRFTECVWVWVCVCVLARIDGCVWMAASVPVCMYMYAWVDAYAVDVVCLPMPILSNVSSSSYDMYPPPYITCILSNFVRLSSVRLKTSCGIWFHCLHTYPGIWFNWGMRRCMRR